MSAATAVRRVRAWYVEGGLVLRAALLMLVVQTVWRSTVTFGSWFWQDDFRYLADARELGLTWDFLLQDYKGHVMPAQFALVWLVTRLEFSFVGPAVTLVVLQLAASVLMLWVLWLLWPRRPEILVGYAVYLFSPLGLVAGTWWAAGLQALPLQCTMLLAVAGCVLDHRTPRLRWKVLSVVALLVGLAFWEKALLVIPLLVLVQVLLLEQARWSDLRAVARRHRVEWAVWLVIGAAYAAAYVVLVGRGEPATGARPSYEHFLVNAVVKTLLPGVLGGPWTRTGGENTVYPPPSAVAVTVAVGVLVLLVAWAWIRQPGATLRAGLLLVAYLAMDFGLVLLARSDMALLLARDPRYVTDALPVVALAATAAFAPVPTAGTGATPVPDWSLAQPLVRVCGAACIVLVTSSWISAQALSDQLSHRYAEDYVTRLLAEHRAMPDAVVVDASAPPGGVAAQPVSVLFAAAGERPRFDRPSADLRMADGFGVLSPVDVPNPEFRLPGPRRGCGWVVGERRVTRVDTSSGAAGVLRVVQLGYLADEDTAVLVGTSWTGPMRYVAVPAGLGRISVLTREEVPAVTFVRPRGTPDLCLTGLTIGAPWPAG